MARELRILGPLEVVDDGRAVDLGGPRQRAVLALLLLHAGEAVPADRLIEELWSGSPPEGAAGTLQSYVSKLRRELGRQTIVTRGGGYALEPGVADLDLRRFERLAAEASGLPAAQAHMAEQEVNTRWQAFMAPLFESPNNARPDELFVELTGVFHLD